MSAQEARGSGLSRPSRVLRSVFVLFGLPLNQLIAQPTIEASPPFAGDAAHFVRAISEKPSTRIVGTSLLVNGIGRRTSGDITSWYRTPKPWRELQNDLGVEVIAPEVVPMGNAWQGRVSISNHGSEPEIYIVSTKIAAEFHTRDIAAVVGPGLSQALIVAPGETGVVGFAATPEQLLQHGVGSNLLRARVRIVRTSDGWGYEDDGAVAISTGYPLSISLSPARRVQLGARVQLTAQLNNPTSQALTGSDVSVNAEGALSVDSEEPSVPIEFGPIQPGQSAIAAVPLKANSLGDASIVVVALASGRQSSVDVAYTVVACLADISNDGSLGFDDCEMFIAAFAAGDSTSDFTGDGFIDFDDFDSFVTAFEDGCELSVGAACVRPRRMLAVGS